MPIQVGLICGAKSFFVIAKREMGLSQLSRLMLNLVLLRLVLLLCLRVLPCGHVGTLDAFAEVDWHSVQVVRALVA